MMENKELKKELLKKVSAADDLLLIKIQSIIEAYEDDEIVACTIEGKSLDKNGYRNEVERSLKESKAGNTLTTDELKIEFEDWKKSFGPE
ncbi:hypothetical protein [Autumnicola edwardsiae]|uniref:Addiction module component n=1 Tax=Autumnicola edwardsiae TaxID=3075594 RepID=A0ABU3CS72_9FLAO|nr:hypothetical protein [Zunongwangia sp. F297]MDT0649209.1 hypothetical protein [Zunongwangia sp. F297]